MEVWVFERHAVLLKWKCKLFLLVVAGVVVVVVVVLLAAVLGGHWM
jgi:hypothetical protein